MTLNQRIEKDLKELYNGGALNGIIKDADALNNAFVTQGQFSTQGLPGHFTGDRNAETIMVMLNPGADAVSANQQLQQEIGMLQISTKTEADFIKTYKTGKTNFGILSINKTDPFDLKQAEFLRDWENSGINIPSNFLTDKSNYPMVIEKVLMKKLQLELIPYCSKKFKPTGKNKTLFYPFIETLFEEIFSKERCYVIFAGAFFEKLFRNKTEMTKIGARITFGVKSHPSKPLKKKDGSDSKISFSCMKILIKYKGNEQEALIAHTYPIQFGGDIICQYGKFCYDTYIKTNPIP